MLALKSSEGWRRWLKTRSKFRRYSFNNQILIAVQKPEASQVAGFKTWQQLNRQVRKGEKAIWILAPRTYKRAEEDPQTGEEILRQGTYFVGVPVFDISQTDGEPLPELPFQPLSGDSHAHHLPPLAALANEIGVSFSIEETGSDAEGYYSPSRKKIVVSPHLSPNAQVATAIHEIAHALGVGYREYGRQDAEVIVESAAFLVMESLGLDTSGSSVPYVASWDKGGASKDEVKALHVFAQKIDEVATRIEDALGVSTGQHAEQSESGAEA